MDFNLKETLFFLPHYIFEFSLIFTPWQQNLCLKTVIFFFSTNRRKLYVAKCFKTCISTLFRFFLHHSLHHLFSCHQMFWVVIQLPHSILIIISVSSNKTRLKTSKCVDLSLQTFRIDIQQFYREKFNVLDTVVTYNYSFIKSLFK